KANPCRPPAPARALRRPASATSTSGWSAMLADLQADRTATDDVLQAALDASDADEIEVIVSAQEHALSRITHNVIHENMVECDRSINIRAVVGKRVGVASTNELDPAGIRTVVARAVAIARVSPADDEFPGLPSPGPAAQQMDWAYDAPTAALTSDDRASAVAQIVRVMRRHGLNAAGYVSTSSGSVAIANSKGIKQFF